MRIMPRRLLSILVAATALAACHHEAPAAKKTVIAAPSEGEARQYVQEFIAAVSKPNIARASAMIDWDILLERAVDGAGGSDRFRDGFIRGAKESSQESSYIQQIAKLVGDGGKIALLRVRGDGHERKALLRMLLPTGAVTYNEMLLSKDATGIVRAADIYAYSSGEYFSSTMRRLYLTALAAEPSTMERLAGKQNTSVESIRMFKEMAEKTAAGLNQEAVDLYKKMPADIKKEKIILVAYVSASANLGEDQYQAAIEELRKNYPNDAGIDLMLIDGYFMKKRYDEAMGCIDRLDRSLGGDPYLDTLRANMMLQKGDIPSATSFARRAAMNEPKLVEAQWSLVNAALARRDFDETARILLHIRDDLGVALADLTEIPEYSEFVRSSAYGRLQ